MKIFKLLAICLLATTLASCGKEKIDSSSDKFYVLLKDSAVDGKTVTLTAEVGSDIRMEDITGTGFYYTEGGSVPEDGSAHYIPATFGEGRLFSATVTLQYGMSCRYKAVVKTAEKDYFSKERGFKTEVLHVSELSISPTSMNFAVGQTKILTITILPAEATDKTYEYKLEDPSIATINPTNNYYILQVDAKKAGSTNLKITTTDGNRTATCPIKVKNAVPEGAVDMGTSVYWAAGDLYDPDSSAPTKYYFAWGEIKSKSEYTKENYVFYYNNKVNYSDGLRNGVLMYTRDAARAIKGGNWRMPTSAEFNELKNACNVVEKYENRRYIAVFTSKTTGKSITFYRDVGCYVGSDNVETDILNLNFLQADLGSDGKPDTFSGGNPQYYGFRIRPVSD